jgi:hypothetical protein
MSFLLPYIIHGQPFARNFVEVTGATITAAAIAAEIQLREKYTKLFNRRVCVAVAEVDFTFRNRDTGEQTEEQKQAEVRARFATADGFAAYAGRRRKRRNRYA